MASTSTYQRLNNFEEQFKFILESSNDLIIILNQKLEIEYINVSVFDKYLGYIKEDLIGKNLLELIYRKDHEKAIKNIGNHSKDKERIIQLRVRDKNKTYHWYEFKRKIFIDHEGNQKILIISKEIQKLMDIEEKLRESEEKFAWITENTNDLIRIFDNRTKIEYINEPTHLKLLGYSSEDLIGELASKFRHPDDNKGVIKFVRDVANKGEGSLEGRMRHKNGHYIWFDIRGKRFRDSKGNWKGLGIARDITEHKKAEKKLLESEERYRDLVNRISDLLLEVSLNGKITYASPQIYDIFGFTFEEIQNKRINKFIHPKDLPKVVKAMKEGFDTRENVTIEYRTLHKDGHYIYASAKGSYMDNGRFYGVVRDITERKVAEKKLKESEMKYRHLFENSPFFIGIVDTTGKLIDSNFAINEFMSLHTKEDVLGKNFNEILSLNDKNKVLIPTFAELFKSSLNGIKKEPFEFELFRSVRDSIWLSVEGSSLEINGKKVLQFFIQDITERKQVEKALKQAVNQWSTTFDAMTDSVFLLNLENTIIQCNKATLEMLGKSEYQEIIGHSCCELLHDLSEPIDWCPMERMKVTGISESSIAQMGDKWVQVSVDPVLDDNDNPIGAVHVIYDITERKIAEALLKESEEKYRLISENANDLIGVLNRKFKYEYINKQTFLQVLGYTNKDLIGKSFLKFIHPEDIEYAANGLKDCFKMGYGSGEVRFKHKNGHWVWIEAKGKIYSDIDGDLKILIVSRDISKRKFAEIRLKDSEKKYRKAYKRANYYKDLFAHDINNILHTINSSAELINFYLYNSEKNKDIDAISNIIQKQVIRGAKLISNVHLISELEERDIPLEQMKINSTLRKSIEYIKNTNSDRDINLKIDTFSDNAIIKANFLLQEVFDNLLTNAVKYNINDTIDISIKISRTKLGIRDCIKMEFMDNGIGVADYRKELIFKRYEKEQKGGKGMGVGLSLVKKIIKNYDGKIWVEDRVEGDYTKGSNFIILMSE